MVCLVLQTVHIHTKYKFQSNTTMYYTKYSEGLKNILCNKLLCLTEIYTLYELDTLG